MTESRRPGLAARAGFALFCVALIAWAVITLFAPSRERLPFAGRPTDIVEFGRGVPVSQEFFIVLRELAAVRVHLRGRGAGDLAWELESADVVSSSAPRLLYRSTQAIAIDGDTAVVIHVPPTPAPGQQFRLTLRLLAREQPLSLVASDLNSYPGALRVDGRERFGDLDLTAIGPSRDAELVAGLGHAPRALRWRGTHVALLGLFLWAVLTFVYVMAFVQEE